MMTSSTTMWLFLTSFSLFIALSYQNVDYSIYPAIYAMDDWVELSDADMTVVVTDVKPIPPVGRADKDTLIYVGLVTYRDARCVTTIENLFKKAKNPDRVRIGKSLSLTLSRSYHIRLQESYNNVTQKMIILIVSMIIVEVVQTNLVRDENNYASLNSLTKTHVVQTMLGISNRN